MEFIEGQSLKEMLEAGSLDFEDAKDIALQVAEGLMEAHEKGIVHRDIKPANIMLTEKSQAKITDFGLAKLSGGVELTMTSTIMGTVAYMSPEQAQGEKVDHRTDIWSLGAMLYEMLAGARPFKKDHEQALIFSILNDEPQSLSAFFSFGACFLLESELHGFSCFEVGFGKKFQEFFPVDFFSVKLNDAFVNVFRREFRLVIRIHLDNQTDNGKTDLGAYGFGYGYVIFVGYKIDVFFQPIWKHSLYSFLHFFIS
jgi:serine/threonine protein kinase